MGGTPTAAPSAHTPAPEAETWPWDGALGNIVMMHAVSRPPGSTQPQSGRPSKAGCSFDGATRITSAP